MAFYFQIHGLFSFLFGHGATQLWGLRLEYKLYLQHTEDLLTRSSRIHLLCSDIQISRYQIPRYVIFSIYFF